MALLLDTHVFYWIVLGSPRLRPEHKHLIVAFPNQVFVSSVSGWEIATKVRLGKWIEAAPLLPGLTNVVERAGLQSLPLTLAQAEIAGSLPGQHKDPFDRLIAAQAIDLDMTLLTVDLAFSGLGCKVA